MARFTIMHIFEVPAKNQTATLWQIVTQSDATGAGEYPPALRRLRRRRNVSRKEVNCLYQRT